MEYPPLDTHDKVPVDAVQVLGEPQGALALVAEDNLLEARQRIREFPFRMNSAHFPPASTQTILHPISAYHAARPKSYIVRRYTTRQSIRTNRVKYPHFRKGVPCCAGPGSRGTEPWRGLYPGLVPGPRFPRLEGRAQFTSGPPGPSGFDP